MSNSVRPVSMPFGKMTDSQWMTREAPGGRLIWDAAAAEPAALLGEWVKDPWQILNLPVLSTIGRTATARLAGSNDTLVVKDMGSNIGNPALMGVPYLRASVALHVGLRMVHSALPEDLSRFDEWHLKYQAPQMYGLFIPNFVPDRIGPPQRRLRPFSLMSRAPETKTEMLLPLRETQMRVYDLALRAAGVEPSAVWLDHGGNAIPYLDKENRVLTITRIDIAANPGRSTSEEFGPTDHLPSNLVEL